MRIYRLHHIKAIIIKNIKNTDKIYISPAVKRLKKMLYSKWEFLFLIFQFALMKVSPCPSKSLTNIWFKLAYIGIYKIKKRCWPICYVKWSNGWKIKICGENSLSSITHAQYRVDFGSDRMFSVKSVEASFFFFSFFPFSLFVPWYNNLPSTT